MTKILFLDIDGVLNSERTSIIYPNQDIHTMPDPVAIGMINTICEKTDCKIVVHSTWRFYIDNEVAMKMILGGFGIKTQYLHKDFMTDTNISGRYESIIDWLARNKKIEKFAILDDAKIITFIPEINDLKKNLVLTDSYNGMSYENYRDVLKILNS